MDLQISSSWQGGEHRTVGRIYNYDQAQFSFEGSSTRAHDLQIRPVSPHNCQSDVSNCYNQVCISEGKFLSMAHAHQSITVVTNSSNFWGCLGW